MRRFDNISRRPRHISDEGLTHSGCSRPDLHKWADTGGALPGRLSDHIRLCPGCADQVRRVSTVHTGLMLLQSQPLPHGLQNRASNRALRMLRRVARASEAAARLLKMRPGLSRWQRAKLHIARVCCGAVAASLVLVVRVGVMTGVYRTRDLGQQLAAAHWDRHIDPNHEWLDPHRMA
jgi:hypothetical protein